MMISTRDLSLLPDIDRLKALMQSLAMLDAILMEDWEYRYFSFDAYWDTDKSVASIRNGSGDEVYAMFAPFGAIIKGFAHESVMSPYRKASPTVWPNVLDNVPSVFNEFLSELAFGPLDTTFCIWRMRGDSAWQCGKIAYPDGDDPDGSKELLSWLDANPETYQKWAEAYYERKVSLSTVKLVYAHQPLTEELIVQLNEDATMEYVMEEAEEIGYVALSD